MPMREVYGNILAAVGSAIVSIPGDTGILHAICLSQIVGDAPLVYRWPAQYYAAIYLSSIDTSQPFPYIMLAQGRVGTYAAISWTGRIRRELGQSIIGVLTGYQDATFALRALTEP